MHQKQLHIISFTVPYPANYGGVYDLFYKLPALQAQGVNIHLHCFDYGRGEQKELAQYCASVHYYPRLNGVKSFSFNTPYIVESRNHPQLLEQLLKDDYPIFMEGVHCTCPLLDKRFSERKMFVRVMNVEYEYYKQLSSCASSIPKKIYYWFESKLLQIYEQAIVKKATAFWALNNKDVSTYRTEFGCTTIDYLPLYLPPWQVNAIEGMGAYCLYHGNLEVAENEKAATWLLTKVFYNIKLPFVIAGKNPSRRLYKLISKNPHAHIIANPSEQEMQDVISKAHVHVLPSFNCTGTKLKLINALYHGRHCVVNDAMIEGTPFSEACHTSNTAEAMQQLIEQLYNQPFTSDEVELRRYLLGTHFSNEANAKQQVEWIWKTYA